MIHVATMGEVHPMAIDPYLKEGKQLTLSKLYCTHVCPILDTPLRCRYNVPMLRKVNIWVDVAHMKKLATLAKKRKG